MADPEGGDVVSINEQYRWGWGRFKALLSRHHRFTLLGSDVLTAKAICRKVRQAFSVHVSVERVKVRTTGGPANFLPISFEVSRGKSGKVGLLVDLYYFLRGAFPATTNSTFGFANSQE